MKLKNLLLLSCAVSLTLSGLFGQVTLNTDPSRVVGHPQVELKTLNPNLVEGRELYAPQGIAVDTAASPNILYVSDTGNNRVLVWKNAAGFSNGAPADLIIGQRDRFTTLPQGPATTFSVGLSSPTGLLVRNGDLYVIDSGNNRILRFPSPVSQQDQFPDLVIGQPNFNSRLPNGGGNPSGSTLAFTAGNSIYRASLTFDGAGNLWVADPGNRRVLRFPANSLTAGNNGPDADVVLGQPDFSTQQAPLTASAQNRVVKTQFAVPSGIAIDPAGRLFVSDSDNNRPDLFSRVLVFAPPFFNGMSATRIMGVVIQAQGGPPVPQTQIDRTVMVDPEGIFMAGNFPAIVDSRSNRILIFDDYSKWPAESASFSPQAVSVAGQFNDFNSRLPNHGQPEASASTLSLPNAAVLAGNELFVADSGNNRVVVLPQGAANPPAFSPAGRVLGQDQFGYSAANLVEGREFQFLSDAGVIVDQTSSPPHLYVADTFNNRILGFNDVRTLKPGDRADVVIGQPDMFRVLCNYPSNDPDRPTQLSLCRPTGLALDAAGNLWVADSGNGRVLRFPAPFTQPGGTQRADLVLGQNSFTSKITDPTSRTMAAPYGLVYVNGTGLLASDAVHNRVLFFPETNGTLTSGMAATKVIGQPDFNASAAGPDANRLNSPHHIATDGTSRLYVTDTGNNRVTIYDVVASLPPSNANAAVSLGQVRNPRGIFVSHQTGEIWVADSGNGRSVRFPEFNSLALNNYSPDFVLPGRTNTLALTADQFGDLYVADAANRVAIYYPGQATLNAASYLVNRPLAPGAIASLFPRGTLFGQTQQAATQLPLPAEMADIQVLVNGGPAPLFFVSPRQINFQVPMSAPTTGTVDVQVFQKSTGQILAAGPVAMNFASPGLFTLDASGNGQVAALNQDNTVNGPTNPAPRRSVISLFLTGQGPVNGAPQDGHAPDGLVTTPEKPRVIIGTSFVPDDNVQFSGLAPGFVGLWQINVQIPDTVAPGNSVLVVVQYKSVNSNGDNQQRVATTISVKD